MILFKKQLFDLEVKVPQRSLQYAIHHLMVMHQTYQISLTYLERQKCYGLDKKILFKKQLFDLEVKSQGTNIMANQVKTLIQNYFEKVLYGNLAFLRFLPCVFFFNRVE